MFITLSLSSESCFWFGFGFGEVCWIADSTVIKSSSDLDRPQLCPIFTALLWASDLYPSSLLGRISCNVHVQDLVHGQKQDGKSVTVDF